MTIVPCGGTWVALWGVQPQSIFTVSLASKSFSHLPRAICEYLSINFPYKLSLDDIYITVGCTQAIEVAISILAAPNANILVPKPGFPNYKLCAAFRNVEIRHFDLLPGG